MKIFKTKVEKLFPQGTNLGELLQKLSSLPLEKVSDAALKGAVTLQRNGKGKILRSRDMRVKLSPNDIVQMTYDERVLSLRVPEGLSSLYEGQHYSVWYKPAGMIAQGSAAGDHTSLLRQVELKQKKEAYLIHRLDRETMGMTVVGHTSEGARLLSELFAQNKVKKIYQAIVRGEMERGHTETISASLDGKEAITLIKSLSNSQGRSLLEIQLETGRLHQIRRHLDFIGYPVMGDPKYGTGNKNRQGLMLLAQSLSFVDPWDKTLKTFVSPVQLEL